MSKIASAPKQSVNKQIHDETRYCENCGISFVWTREEQRQRRSELVLHGETSDLPAVAPMHCPGCRVLISLAPRERGLVKWYHRRKGYGFISRLGAPDLYVHRSAIEAEKMDADLLATDDLVEFAVGHNEQGAVAEAVRLLSRQS